MGAISLYRGNLHRVSEVPRRWPMPPRTLSLRHFKVLLHNRALALSLRHGTAPAPTTHEEAAKAEGKREEDGDGEDKKEEDEEGMGDNGCCPRPPSSSGKREEEPMAARRDDDRVEKPLQEPEPIAINATSGSGRADRKDFGEEKVGDAEKGEGSGAQVKTEVSHNLQIASNREEKKKELQKKLHVLNEKKHHLVQMLKQIISAEEEIKRRSFQPCGFRASIPFQGEPAVDMGSVTRHFPKISVEVNFGGEMGGEHDDPANRNNPARHLYSTHSISPAAAFPLNRPFHAAFPQNSLFHTPRTGMAISGHGQTASNVLMSNATTASPLCVGPARNTTQAPGLLPGSGPGMQFVASSPSPAASGTPSSVFRDPRKTSPSWN